MSSCPMWIGGPLCALGGRVVFGFGIDVKRWSALVNRVQDDRGVCFSDATIMTVVVALVVAVGWFAFGDSVNGFMRRM